MADATVTTRGVTPEDAARLFEIFLAGESAAWAAAIPQIDNGPVLRRMFASQQAEYTDRYPQARHEIILIDGEFAGQVRWAEDDHELHLIDIALLPQHRRRGAAHAVLARILAHARDAKKPLRSMVTRVNAASLALHRCAGFILETESDTHYFLVAR